MDRVEKGFKLYSEGNVKLIFFSKDEIHLEVTSDKIVYLVSILNGVARCNECGDYRFRFKRESNAKNGSFLCCHIYAALFKLGELLKSGEIAYE